MWDQDDSGTDLVQNAGFVGWFDIFEQFSRQNKNDGSRTHRAQHRWPALLGPRSIIIPELSCSCDPLSAGAPKLVDGSIGDLE